MLPIRRSRSAAGFLAVAFLIAASGCGADPPDRLTSPPAADSTAVAVSAPFDAMLGESKYVPVQWLVPWDDGFLAVGVGYTELLATWSTDGDSWIPTEMAPLGTIGDVAQLVVSGDRLTVAGAIRPGEDGGPWIVTVASTTDLENWITASFPLPPPDGLPDGVQIWVVPSTVAADDEHWVVRVMVDVMAGPTSGPSDSQPRAELWSGAWGGEPAMSDTGQQFATLVSTSDGFLELGERVAFSPDGQMWTQVPEPAPNVSFYAAAPLGDGAVAMTGTPYGESSIVTLDATGTNMTEVAIPDLGNGFFPWGLMSSPAFIVATGMAAPDEQTIIVEYDGFELTQEYSDVAAYRLVDLSTGEVVVEESVDLRTTEITEDRPFEYLAEDMSGITITDPETGVTIVEIPRSAIDKAWEETRESDETTLDAGQPDLWLLATNDGETWLIEDLDGGISARITVATNGTQVLVGTTEFGRVTGVWQRFAMTE